MEKTSFESLRRFNMIMGGLHLVQGILMIIIALTVISTVNPAFQITITQNFLNFDPIAQRLFLD